MSPAHRRDFEAMPRAIRRLKTTAWTLLESKEQVVVLTSIHAELDKVIAQKLELTPNGRDWEYNLIVEIAIHQAFYNNLHFFSFEMDGDDSEHEKMDDSNVDELLNWEVFV